MQVSGIFKQTFLLFLLAAISFSSFAGQGKSNRYFSNYNFYLGFDSGALQTRFQQGYGDNLFDDIQPDYNFYFGARKNRSFGFETGFSITPENQYDTRLIAGEKFPGTSVALQTSEWELWESTIKVKSGYLGINWYSKFGRIMWLYLLSGAEVTHMDITTTLKDDDLPGLPNNIRYTFSKTAIVPMLKAGVNWEFTNWGIRFYYAWRNYKRFNNLTCQEFPTQSAHLRLDNSNSLYLGTYLVF